jgi:hypothetical protein
MDIITFGDRHQIPGKTDLRNGTGHPPGARHGRRVDCLSETKLQCEISIDERERSLSLIHQTPKGRRMVTIW